MSCRVASSESSFQQVELELLFHCTEKYSHCPGCVQALEKVPRPARRKPETTHKHELQIEIRSSCICSQYSTAIRVFASSLERFADCLFTTCLAALPLDCSKCSKQKPHWKNNKSETSRLGWFFAECFSVWPDSWASALYHSAGAILRGKALVETWAHPSLEKKPHFQICGTKRKLQVNWRCAKNYDLEMLSPLWCRYFGDNWG